ncbi:MAG: thioredoxin family protein [Thermomicrobiales bacterium]
MIERLLMALIVIVAIAVIGLVLQGVVARWRRRRLGSLNLAATRLPRLITFSTSGCTQCRTQRRILDAVVAEWRGSLDVTYVDAADEPDLAHTFGVIVVPTTVVAAPDGRIIGVNGGLADAHRLLRQLSEAAA